MVENTKSTEVPCHRMSSQCLRTGDAILIFAVRSSAYLSNLLLTHSCELTWAEIMSGISRVFVIILMPMI